MQPLPHHNDYVFCEPLESRIAPAALTMAVAGHGEESEAVIPATPGHITFIVSLDAPQNTAVGVDYFTSDGTATAGADYSSTAGTLVFAPGETSKSITVPVLDDTAVESDETFVLNLANPIGASLGDATAAATIWDNDTLVDFAGQEIAEGDDTNQNALFTFVLGSPLAHPVSISFSTKDITATAGLDYLPANGVVTFQPGETAKVVTVSILGDKLDEYAEEFSLVTSALSGARFGGGLPMRILDDDSRPGVSIGDTELVEGQAGYTEVALVVTLDSPSTKTITVNLATGGGTATAGTDYIPLAEVLTFAPGEITKTITIPVAGDMEPESDEYFSVQISSATNAEIKHGSATVTILSDDSIDPLPVLSIENATITEGDTRESYATFTVTLNAPSTRTIQVAYSDIPDTATDGEDYISKSGVLAFAPGETSKNIRIKVVGDFKTEPDEAFTVILSSPVNATLGDAVGTGTIVNDDVPVTPIITISDATIVEATATAGHAAFAITLTSTSADSVTVSFATIGGSATPGVDFVPTAGSITFAPGERTQTIYVTIIGDSVVEPDESFGLTLSAPINGNLDDMDAIATIVDDDQAGAAPAGFVVKPRLAKWIDTDGDVVRVVSSLPILVPGLFQFDANGNLALLNLSTVHVGGTNLSFAVKRGHSGDGSVGIGAIESPGKDLGIVTVKGSLGRIVAGDSKMATPGLRALTVETFGFLAGESGPSSLRSDVAGAITKLVVKKAFNGAAVYASGTGAGIKSTLVTGNMMATPEATDTGLHADGVIGTVRVTRSIAGADADHPVQIFAAGPPTRGNAIQNVTVLGEMQFAQVVAGHGASPLVAACWTSIGTVNVKGALLASTISAGLAPNEGGFFGATEYSPLPGDHGTYARIARVIVGNAPTGGVINGTPDEISSADHFGIFARQIASVRIGGKAVPLHIYMQESYAIGTTGDVLCREF